MSDELEVKEGPAVVDSPLPLDDNPVSKPADDPLDIVDPGEELEWDLGTEFPDKTETLAQEKAPEQESQDDGFDEELLGYASQFGYTKEDFATPLQLTKAIASIHKILAKSGGQENEPAPTPTVPAAKPAPQPRADKGDVEFEFSVPEALLDPNQFDQEVVAFAQSVKGLNEHLQGKLSEVAQLRGIVGELLGNTVSQQQERYFDEVDKIFATDEAMADTFGKGNRFELNQATPQFAARKALLEQMDITRAVYAQQGKPIPSTEKLYAIAKGVLHSDKTTQIARRQIADRLRDAKGKFTAPPVHKRQGELPPGPDRAIAAVAKAMRESKVFSTDVDTGLE